MRILHIATYVSVDAAVGGPLAVARAQTGELASRGHQVQLLAGWDGVAGLHVPGVRVRLFRARQLGGRVATLVSPSLWRATFRAARTADVVHLHMGRDLMTLGAAYMAVLAGARIVLQPHGMVIPDSRPYIRVLDAIVTRPVFRRAAALFALTRIEVEQLGEVGRTALPIRRLNNGVAPQGKSSPTKDSTGTDVLFLARLQTRKRIMVFADAARRILQQRPDVRFSVVGPDEGELATLQAFIRDHSLEDRIVYEGALPAEQVRARLARATIYVLPSVNEVFPMTVLEAMDECVPVVITDSCGIADELQRLGAASVVDTTVESLVDGIDRLLEDAVFRDALASAGFDSVRTAFSIGPVVDSLETYYSEAIGRSNPAA